MRQTASLPLLPLRREAGRGSDSGRPEAAGAGGWRAALAPLLLTLLLGCGGHGGNSSPAPSSATTNVGKGKGRAVLRVKWPARTSARLIPNAADEITVNLLQGTTVVAVTKIPRPASGSTSTTTTLTGLAYGTYTVWAQAYPNADGSGVAQAYGGGSMAVTEDVPGSLGVSLDSTVAALAIVPAAPVIGTIGGTATLTASATDASGNVVLLAANGASEPLTWTCDDTAVAMVSGTGPTATLTAVAAGTANVTASLRYDDAGDVVSTIPTPVSVSGTTVTVSPNPNRIVYKYVSGSLSQGIVSGYYPDPGTISFHATLGASLAGSTVVWSLSGSGSTIGAIDQSGKLQLAGPFVNPPTLNDTVTATVTKDGVSYTGTATVTNSIQR